MVVDDFFRFTWVMFLAHKNIIFSSFTKLCRRLQNEKDLKISNIRTDHGRELENESFAQFCDNLGIGHNFLALRIPQQNGVVERKNRSMIRPILKKTPYEL